MRSRVIFAALFVLSSTALADEMILVYPGKQGTQQQAQPLLDSWVDYIESRAGWAKGANAAVSKTATAAAVTTDPKKRTALFQQFQRQLNQSGPYFPLMQPTQVFVATSDLKNAVYNAVYSVDVTKVAPR